MKEKTIVIDREYGSGGREIGRILSEKLGIKFYDSNLLVLAAQEHGINIDTMLEYDEVSVGSMLYNIAVASNNLNDPGDLEIPYQIYEAESDVMKQLVAKKPCIIMGRCADEILKDTTALMKVYVYSNDMTKKIERIKKVDHIIDNTEYVIHKKDNQRKNYYLYFTQKEWGDRKNYDLCINTADLEYEKAADIIMAALDKS